MSFGGGLDGVAAEVDSDRGAWDEVVAPVGGGADQEVAFVFGVADGVGVFSAGFSAGDGDDEELLLSRAADAQAGLPHTRRVGMDRMVRQGGVG